MNDRLKRRKAYLEKNKKYLSSSEQAELDRIISQERIYANADAEKDFQRSKLRSASSHKNTEASDDSKSDTTNQENIKQENTKKTVRKKSNKKAPKKDKKNKKKHSGWRIFWLILLIIILLMIGFFAYGYYRVKNSTEKVASQEQFDGQKNKNGAINILILGTDQRDFQSTEDARSDSIMLLQIGAPDKKVKLVSFMRDTLVEIPGASYYGPDSKLNVAFNLGEQDGHKGAEMVRETLSQNFGVNAQYYAMVNFSSFAEVIDSLFPAGVKIDAQFSTIDGEKVSEVQVPDDLSISPDNPNPEETIKTGEQRMNGQTLLNYARFRKDDEGDYGRTKRQRQVLEAIISQSKNPLTLFTGSSAIGTIKALTSTDVPSTVMMTESIPTVLESKNGIESYTVPENGDWEDVQDQYGGDALSIDFDKYRSKLNKTLGD